MNPLEFSGFPNVNPPEPTNNDEDLSSGFLKDVEEADRAVLEKYLPKWNGQVTKRFQDIHGQYAPYKQIGMDPDTLKSAAWLYSQLDSDPVDMYKKIHKALKESGMWEDPEGNDEQPVGGNQQQLPEFDGIPKEFLDQFQSMRDELAQLRETTTGFIGSQQEQQEEALLDNVLNQMHTQLGDFDDEWILTRLARGKSPQEAFTEYTAFVEKIGGNNRQRKPAPNPKERKAFIAAALEAAQS
jgi:hypothetical protein